MTIDEAQKQVDEWIKTVGVRYFSELTNMACLTEEVGELARVMARRYGDQSFKEGENCNLEEEMADVLWVLICLANQTGVNLTEALRKSIEKKTRRDKERHINNRRKSAGKQHDGSQKIPDGQCGTDLIEHHGQRRKHPPFHGTRERIRGHLPRPAARGHHLRLSLLRTNRQPIARSGWRGSSLRVGQFPLLASPD